MDPFLISIVAFVAVAALVGAIVYVMQDFGPTAAEDRLKVLTGRQGGDDVERSITKEDLVREGVGGLTAVLRKISQRFANLGSFFEQADSPIKLEAFFLISCGTGLLGVLAAWVGGSPVPLYPVAGLLAGLLPFLWLCMRRRSRLKKFAHQLPDALELIGRALRSGHSLASGLNVVHEEMASPIGTEFGLVYEEQNLGIPVETALKGMLKRVPNMDLKFFVTAVAIQRQAGGDMAEILDKIGYIIRERFKILGQVQALTGEGRISGIVLMILPVALFLAIYHLNAEYVMLLFTDPLGQKMIAFGALMQVFGAIAIKKIIAIKV